MAHDLHRRSTAPMADTAAITFLPYHHTVCTIRIATTPTHDLHRCVTTCRLPPSRLYPSTLNCSSRLPIDAPTAPVHSLISPTRQLASFLLWILSRRPSTSSALPPPFATLWPPIATTPTRDMPRRSTQPLLPPPLSCSRPCGAYYRASSLYVGLVTSSHYVFCPTHHHHSPPSVPHLRPSPLRLHVICLDAQPLLPLPLVSSSHHRGLLTTELLPSCHVVPLRLLPYAPPPFAPLCAPSATFATTPTTPTRNLRSTAPATPPRLFPLVSSSHHRGLLTTELNSSAAYASPNAIPDTTTALLSSTAYVHLLDLLPRHDPHRCCMTPLSAV
jgi:hypothetical protein